MKLEVLEVLNDLNELCMAYSLSFLLEVEG